MYNRYFRSNILSLDLSFNGLTALNDTLRTLKNLPKLNSLLLIGNPLFVSPIIFHIASIYIYKYIHIYM